MLVNLINKNLASLILFFATSPGRRYTRKDIKNGAKMNNVPLDTSLRKIVNLGVIKKDKNLFYLNVEDELVKQLLSEIKDKFAGIPFKIQKIVIEFMSETLEIARIKNIILFGSYSKLIFTEHSDIDFAVVLENENPEIKKKITLIAEKLSKKYKKKIHENFLLEEELKHKREPIVKEILNNGRVLFP